MLKSYSLRYITEGVLSKLVYPPIASCIALQRVTMVLSPKSSSLHKLMAITWSILNGFSKFFHCWKVNQLNFQQSPYNTPPLYFQYVAALPCEI